MTTSQQSGPPSTEQLTQYLMITRGLNREIAGQEVAADPDTITAQYMKVKALIESGGQDPTSPPSGTTGSGTTGSGSTHGTHGRRGE